MSRHNAISPYLPPGRHGYYASFAGREGKRVNASLGTQDLDEARAICRHLLDLQSSGLPEGAPSTALYHPRAYRLWFGSERPPQFLSEAADPASGFLFDATERAQLLGRITRLEAELAEAQGYKAKYLALSSELEARRLHAHKQSPTLDEVRDAYFQDIAHLARGGAGGRTSFDRFRLAIGGATKIADITSGQIQRYIQEAQASAPHDVHRGQRERAACTRFFGWVARTHKISSPMDQVPATRIKAQADISWPSLEEVESMIAAEGDGYWQSVIATLAFAGLSAHELRGLRIEDIQAVDSSPGKGRKAGGAAQRRVLRIQPHDERGLKTHNRKRSIQISSRLEPYIDHMLQQAETGQIYLFPALSGGSELGMWHPATFSRDLGEHLPDGITALHLRRTFGSLLIRSGKKEEEVAAAMGNTPAMVRNHYARILGHEVDITF